MTTVKRLVTIGVPIYKRLQYLPHILGLVQAQDYPAIELIVSDNGENGTAVRDLVQQHYSRPYRFRQNPATVPISAHFNQLVQEASGEFFALLADDDEISSNYASGLVRQFERYPDASVGIARQEILSEEGIVIRKSAEELPHTLSGPDFIRAVWPRNDFKFECFSTFLARTEQVRSMGGYPNFARGNHIENALLIKLILNNSVVLSSDCVFRWRVDPRSYGWSVSIRDLAAACREFLRFLRQDSVIQDFAARHPDSWRPLHDGLVQMAWRTYLWRWKSLYQEGLPRLRWWKAAFALPPIKDYYREVAVVLIQDVKSRTKRLVLGQRPPERAANWFKG